MKQTQHELILKWVDRYGFITPAKMGGAAWAGGFFGSETPKRCRELFDKGILSREQDGKFKTFRRATTQAYVPSQLNIL